jgi:hypothetical protein
MTAPKVEAQQAAGSNPCKLTECQGKPRCVTCALMDRADAYLAAKEPPKPQVPAVAALADAIDALDATLDENVPYERTPVYEAMAAVKQAYRALATPQPPAQPQAHADLREALAWIEKEAVDLRVCGLPNKEAKARNALEAVRAAAGTLVEQRAELMRTWFVLKDFGAHPGRTDDKLSDCVRAALSAPPPAQAAEPWSAEEAVELAHRAGFSGTCWTVGPEELVHMLNMVACPPPAASAEGKKS